MRGALISSWSPQRGVPECPALLIFQLLPPPPPWDSCRSHSYTSECRTVTPPEPSLPAPVVRLIFFVPQSLYLKNGCDNGIPLSGLSWGLPAHTGKAPRTLPSILYALTWVHYSLPPFISPFFPPSFPLSLCQSVFVKALP